MNWLHKICQGLDIRLTDECTGAAHGQVDCVIKAYSGDRLVGYLTYAVFDNKAHIQYVEVAEDMRRHGIATMMYHQLKSEYDVEHGMSTADGTAWRDRL